jgi:hypothetical protein
MGEKQNKLTNIMLIFFLFGGNPVCANFIVKSSEPLFVIGFLPSLPSDSMGKLLPATKKEERLRNRVG